MSPWLLLTAAALVVVSLGWLHYLWLIPRERVPARPLAHALVLGAAALAGLAGAVLGSVRATAPLDLLSVPLGATALVVGGFFHYLLRQRHLPDGERAFELGQPLPAFTALTREGARLESSSLRGERVLLKLFRGSW